MDVKIVLAIVLVAVVISFAAIQMVQINSISSKLSTTGLVAGTGATGSIDMSGWTETEKMNYEHHGTLPARYQQSSSQPSSSMVGGC